MDYAFVHEGRAYTPNRSAVDTKGAEAHNAAIEAAELAQWREKPDRQLAYYDEAKGTVSTWLGTVLGTITEWRVYRHNFGGKFISLRVRGSNGARYYGRASHEFQCVLLRRAK